MTSESHPSRMARLL